MSDGATRRGFLAGGGALLGAGCFGRRGGKTWLVPNLSPEEPDAHQLETLRAIADTFVPDWDGGPGAIESDALAVLVHPDYGLNPYITELCADLDDWCWLTYGGEFARLGRADRNRALEQRMGFHGRIIQSLYREAYEGALALTKLSYFGGVPRSVGTAHIGFPGPSAGYAPDSAAGAYRSHDTPRALPNSSLAGIDSTIAVDGAGRVARLTINLHVVHGDPSDLRLTLHSPAGTAHPLWEGKRARGGITFHDQPLAAFAGEPAAGAWRLHLVDPAGTASGKLHFWQLVLRTDLDG